jgi:RNA polymerase sigma factor, sigma-70 family
MFLESDNELLDRLMQIIDRLEPPIRKLIIKLRYLQEMSYQEIADQQGVSKVTVYNHLSQAIDFIRKQLK